jgi:hypothetical protein
MATPRVRVTIDGRTALTIRQAAQRYGLGLSTMRAALTRLRQAGKLTGEARLDDRTPVYPQRGLDALMRGRPGRGANLRRLPSGE